MAAPRFVGHPAVAHAVEEIDDEAEQQPDAKPEPRVAWQSEHEQHRRQRSRWRDEIDRRRPEGTLDVWLRDAQRKHAETDDGEGKQRADAHQLTDKPDRQQPRQNRDDDADGNGADVRRAEARMNLGAERRQQPVARHGIEDARLADQQHEDDRG